MALVGRGILGPGGSEYFDVVLTGGHTYGVYVDAFEPNVDFDLYIYDENGNLITQDSSTATDAYCMVTPSWTGPFRLVVNAHRGMSGFEIQVRD